MPRVYITSLLLGCAHPGCAGFIFSCCPLLPFQLPRREIHGGVSASDPKFPSPPSRWWQLWVLPWENISGRLEPAVPGGREQRGGAAPLLPIPAVGTCRRSPSPAQPLSASRSGSLFALKAWRAPLLTKLCQFASAKLLAPRVD